ncbi:phage tail protein [Kosakonia sp. H7A]|uniref:phage tail protein n=1 Tax=Kosakonia TaxID=1330547 RepID=UPI000272EDBB|nr:MULTISPECIES: phage tail protein [Kosakonia]PTA87418.1 phage tail protein [Kosakonia sp. H7A]
MTAKYFAILTNQGAARLANATAIGTSLNLTQIAIGDGNGVLPTPDATQTRLVNQKRIAPLNALSIDPTNTSQIIAEQIIPENEGGYWIRELGLYDDEGVLIAVANCPETYKPLMQEGSGRTQTIRMVITVSSTAAVTLKIDPAVVLATRKYVDDKAIEVRTYADNLMSQHVAAGNPHAQYPLIANALKEMANAGLVSSVQSNLGLSSLVQAGTASGLLATAGYFQIPGILNGGKQALIIQWMKVTTSVNNGENSVFTWPIAFPNACLNTQVTYTEGSSPFTDITVPIFVVARSLQNITIRSYSGAGNGIDILAIGF